MVYYVVWMQHPALSTRSVYVAILMYVQNKVACAAHWLRCHCLTVVDYAFLQTMMQFIDDVLDMLEIHFDGFSISFFFFHLFINNASKRCHNFNSIFNIFFFFFWFTFNLCLSTLYAWVAWLVWLFESSLAPPDTFRLVETMGFLFYAQLFDQMSDLLALFVTIDTIIVVVIVIIWMVVIVCFEII